jgi:integrase
MGKMTREKLTVEALRKAKPKARRYRLWDADVPGLFVSVSPNGIKSFNVQWSRTGCKSIGKFSGMTIEAARVRARGILADAAEKGTPGVAAKKAAVATFKAFMDDHYAPWVEAERKAGKATVANIRAQFSDFDAKPLTAITPLAIEKFKAKRMRGDADEGIKGVSPTTVNRDLDRIRAALGKAVEWGMLPVNPLAGVKRSKVEDESRVRFLNAAEEARLRAALATREDERRRRRASGIAHAVARHREPLPPFADDEYTDHVAPLVLLAMNTGLRRGELLGLAWAAVDRQAKRIKVTAATAKSQRVRYVPLNSEAATVIERLHKHAANKTGLVFAGGEGAPMTHIKRSWASLMAAAQLEDFHFHDLRHHFASKLVMAGVDLYAVKELLGHSDFEMTQRYAHLSAEHKAAAVERLVS